MPAPAAGTSLAVAGGVTLSRPGTGQGGPFGRGAADDFAIAATALRPDPVGTMEPGAQMAYELPLLYRKILDAIAALERAGQRGLAADLRRRAVATYSRSWDARAHRRLTEILQRCERVLIDAGDPRDAREARSEAADEPRGSRSRPPADDPALGGLVG